MEFKFGGAFLIVFMTEFAEFFGQDGYPTVENSCSNLPNPQQNYVRRKQINCVGFVILIGIVDSPILALACFVHVLLKTFFQLGLAKWVLT